MNKKTVFLIIVFLHCFCALNAQDDGCYNYTRSQGIEYYNQGNYSAARLRFVYAKDCPDIPSGNDLDSWIRKCDSAIAEQRQAAEEREMASKGYMNINRLEFEYETKDAPDVYISLAGSNVSASDITYLYTDVHYTGLASENKDIKLDVRIFKPSGAMMSGSKSPAGYSYSHTITINPGPGESSLSGFGSASGGSYQAGKYRVEIWYNGNKLYQQELVLEGSKQATSLMVNHKEAVSHSFPASGGNQTFYVTSDGEWSLWGVPSFCSVTAKTSTSFTLKCNENTGNSQRKDWFRVESGDKKVRIDISQEGNGPTAEIESVWVDHNVYQDNVHGMMIHTKFTIDKMNGKTGHLSIYFHKDDGTPLRDTNGSYKTIDGYVATGEDFTPIYDSSTFGDYWMFMPTGELHITSSGKTYCYFIVVIKDNNGAEICRSEKYHFNITM